MTLSKFGPVRPGRSVPDMGASVETHLEGFAAPFSWKRVVFLLSSVPAKLKTRSEAVRMDEETNKVSPRT